MIRTAVFFAAVLAAPAVLAQSQGGDGTIAIIPLDDPELRPLPPEAANRDLVDLGGGAVIRALDKVSGDVVEVSLRSGEVTTYGLIEIALGECRYPRGNPAGDAYAWIEVRTLSRGTNDFKGWMIASSPALNALDHARYDVWVMRCISA